MSDTHGRLDLAERAVKAASGADLVVHLGDMEADGRRLAARLGVEVTSVRGNCDGDFSEGNYKILDTEGGRILLAHGHREGVKSGLMRLCYRAAELGCKAALYGHTHVARVDEAEGLLLVNPGTLGHPRLGGRPSYAVVDATREGIFASIVYMGD